MNGNKFSARRYSHKLIKKITLPKPSPALEKHPKTKTKNEDELHIAFSS